MERSCINCLYVDLKNFDVGRTGYSALSFLNHVFGRFEVAASEHGWFCSASVSLDLVFTIQKVLGCSYGPAVNAMILPLV